MSARNPCFNPKNFTPAKGALLSLGQWQMLQLYLVDAQNLRLTPEEMPFASIREIYVKLNAQAIDFNRDVLPEAQGLGNKLVDYGRTASKSFQAMTKLMQSSTPDVKAILQLLNSLKNTATNYRKDAESVFDAISLYTLDTQQNLTDLNDGIRAEMSMIAKDKSEITVLQSDYTSVYANKQSAQSQIVRDQKVIRDTKYYSWIPFIGTAVATGEIISKEHNIQEQLDIISADVAEMQKITTRMNSLHKQVAQLVYSQNFNRHMVSEVTNAMNGLQLFQGAWGTIVQELEDVINNLNNAKSASLKDQKCLTSVYLATAATEWEQVGENAEAFTLNFYLQPASKTDV